MTNVPSCPTCNVTTCWLCKGNAYFDKAMSLPKTFEKREHVAIIELHREQVRQKGCLFHPGAREYLMKQEVK